MSTSPPTSVRLPISLRAEIRERARTERRSFSSQLIVLLEAVERSCAEQGIPVKMTDPFALAEIAAILAEGREKRGSS
jgi:hypothetical protein